jgi:hypothetical protein
MTQTTLSRSLLGRYGLYALSAAMLGIFVVFLLVFNFTPFF